MGQLAIKVEHLGKRYKIGAKQEAYRTLRSTVTDVVTAPFRRRNRTGDPGCQAAESSHIWAMKDASFEINRGEIVGIIGRNGAGKSTLLKLLSRITEPTTGYADIHGRVGSLLEVGTGFHPELSGRENIYLNGAILGMRKVEIDQKFDEMVAFAEIDRFIDTPVKHYSSGMYLRLAFAVAAHLDQDILLVDEVLAVGDFAFQAKCLGRMQAVGREDRTIVLVTHNMAVVSQLCHRVILLEGGRVAAEGSPRTILERYLKSTKAGVCEWIREAGTFANHGMAIRSLKMYGQDGDSFEEVPSNHSYHVEVTYEVLTEHMQGRIVLEVETVEGVIILATTDCDSKHGMDRPRAPGTYTARCTFPPHLLAPGTYYLTAAASQTQRVEWDRVPRAIAFRISRIGSLSLVDNRPGLIAPILSWEQEVG